MTPISRFWEPENFLTPTKRAHDLEKKRGEHPKSWSCRVYQIARLNFATILFREGGWAFVPNNAICVGARSLASVQSPSRSLPLIT